ncbi:MAG: dUTP diphosphatase [Candidatus Bruticola sp.]
MCDCTVKVELIHEKARLPKKAFPTDAAYDLFLPVKTVLAPGQTKVLKMGLRFEMPAGWEAQIRGRSGLAVRGLTVHFGTIDHLYRKELGVIVHNLSSEIIELQEGDRVAQVKFDKVWHTNLVCEIVSDTERGGFGSTGS